MESTTACAFNAMFEAAKKDGIILKIGSAFRTFERQKHFWKINKCERVNKKNVCEGREAAFPGTSKHGLGLALDLNATCSNVQKNKHPTKCANDKVYLWLIKHAHKYSFKRTVQSET